MGASRVLGSLVQERLRTDRYVSDYVWGLDADTVGETMGKAHLSRRPMFRAEITWNWTCLSMGSMNWIHLGSIKNTGALFIRPT